MCFSLANLLSDYGLHSSRFVDSVASTAIPHLDAGERNRPDQISPLGNHRSSHARCSASKITSLPRLRILL
jgi:hypothetical protein